MARIAIILLIICFSASFCKAECYWRDGTLNTDNRYHPCSDNSSSPLSKVCCAEWNICLPNGLCQQGDSQYWRESCTEQDWNIGGCQELCSSEDSQNIDVIVTPCDGTNSSLAWCCGNNDQCCKAGSDVPSYIIARNFGDPIPTPSSSSVASSSATSPASSTVEPSLSLTTSQATASAPSAAIAASSAPDTSGGLSTGAKAGIGVGVAFGAIAFIALGVFLAKAMRWRKKASQPYKYAPASHPQQGASEYPELVQSGHYKHQSTGKYESSASEMEARSPPQELPVYEGR